MSRIVGGTTVNLGPASRSTWGSRRWTRRSGVRRHGRAPRPRPRIQSRTRSRSSRRSTLPQRVENTMDAELLKDPPGRSAGNEELPPGALIVDNGPDPPEGGRVRGGQQVPRPEDITGDSTFIGPGPEVVHVRGDRPEKGSKLLAASSPIHPPRCQAAWPVDSRPPRHRPCPPRQGRHPGVRQGLAALPAAAHQLRLYVAASAAPDAVTVVPAASALKPERRRALARLALLGPSIASRSSLCRSRDRPERCAALRLPAPVSQGRSCSCSSAARSASRCYPGT